MSVFKELSDSDVIKRRKENQTTPLFSDNRVLLSKTVDGWDKTKNYTYADDPLVTGSVYFVENDSFYVTYAKDSQNDEDQFLGWNSIMSSIGAEWNQDTEKYNYVVSGSTITEVIAISFSPERINDSIDFDNFFVTMSGSTGNNYTTASGNNYDVSESLVLAPYYIKSTINDLGNSGTTSTIRPAYELRTSDSNNFLSYDSSSKSISIDWDQGTVSGVMGVVYPDVGIILLFPELFNRSQITTAIRTGDRSLNSLNSIMDIAGYSIKRVEKTIVFSRLFFDEGNQTVNPTAFVKSGNSYVYRNEIRDNMRTFITRIGFYNTQNECLAVAHISNPIRKDDFTEKTFKIEIEN